MRSTELHAVGFDFESLDALTEAAYEAGVRGVNTAPGFRLIGAYTDPSGARLGLLHREGGEPTATAALASPITYRAQVVRFTDHLARVTLYAPDDEGKLLVQFISLVDDPLAYPHHDLSRPSDFAVVEALQVAAIAMDIEVFADDAAFLASPKATLGGLALSPTSFFSPSLIALQAAAIPPAEAAPTLLMAVRVEDVEVRRNHLSGASFQFVRARGAVELAVAVPIEHPVAPGNVLFGTFYASCSSGTWDEPTDGAHQ